MASYIEFNFEYLNLPDLCAIYGDIGHLGPACPLAAKVQDGEDDSQFPSSHANSSSCPPRG